MIRQGVVVLLVVALANGLYGYPVPVDMSGVGTAVVGVVLFAGYVYLGRTLLRLPVALWDGWRRFRRAREVYEHDRRAALLDGLYGGFLNTRRWEGRPWDLVDRVFLLLIVWEGCDPHSGPLLVGVGGVSGVLLLVLLWVGRGSFGGLVGDGFGTHGDWPDIPNLRH